MTLDIDPPFDPNKVVINDLSAELAEIEAEERREAEQAQEREFFLPDDIEDQISGVPAHVLRNASRNKPHAPDSQALILYKPITSLSVPEEDDAVRKAVIEARKRMRERQRSPPPPSPYSDHDTDVDDGHDNDAISTAEPYIRNGLTADYPHRTHDDRDSGRRGRFTREETPFPFPNPNVRQPILSAPYVPLDMDDDGHVDHNHHRDHDRDYDQDINDLGRQLCDWDDAMDIE